MIPAVKSTVAEDKAKRVVEKEFTVRWTYKGRPYSLTVPKGFRYRPGIALRFGSLGLIDIFAPTYSLEDASCAHDYAYAKRKEGMSRGAADALMLCDNDDPHWVRVLAHLVVRAVGWTVW